MFPKGNTQVFKDVQALLSSKDSMLTAAMATSERQAKRLQAKVAQLQEQIRGFKENLQNRDEDIQQHTRTIDLLNKVVLSYHAEAMDGLISFGTLHRRGRDKDAALVPTKEGSPTKADETNARSPPHTSRASLGFLSEKLSALQSTLQAVAESLDEDAAPLDGTKPTRSSSNLVAIAELAQRNNIDLELATVIFDCDEAQHKVKLLQQKQKQQRVLKTIILHEQKAQLEQLKQQAFTNMREMATNESALQNLKTKLNITLKEYKELDAKYAKKQARVEILETELQQVKENRDRILKTMAGKLEEQQRTFQHQKDKQSKILNGLSADLLRERNEFVRKMEEINKVLQEKQQQLDNSQKAQQKLKDQLQKSHEDIQQLTSEIKERETTNELLQKRIYELEQVILLQPVTRNTGGVLESAVLKQDVRKEYKRKLDQVFEHLKSRLDLLDSTKAQKLAGFLFGDELKGFLTENFDEWSLSGSASGSDSGTSTPADPVAYTFEQINESLQRSSAEEAEESADADAGSPAAADSGIHAGRKRKKKHGRTSPEKVEHKVQRKRHQSRTAKGKGKAKEATDEETDSMADYETELIDFGKLNTEQRARIASKYLAGSRGKERADAPSLAGKRASKQIPKPVRELDTQLRALLSDESADPAAVQKVALELQRAKMTEAKVEKGESRSKGRRHGGQSLSRDYSAIILKAMKLLSPSQEKTEEQEEHIVAELQTAFADMQAHVDKLKKAEEIGEWQRLLQEGGHGLDADEASTGVSPTVSSSVPLFVEHDGEIFLNDKAGAAKYDFRLRRMTHEPDALMLGTNKGLVDEITHKASRKTREDDGLVAAPTRDKLDVDPQTNRRRLSILDFYRLKDTSHDQALRSLLIALGTAKPEAVEKMTDAAVRKAAREEIAKRKRVNAATLQGTTEQLVAMATELLHKEEAQLAYRSVLASCEHFLPHELQQLDDAEVKRRLISLIAQRTGRHPSRYLRMSDEELMAEIDRVAQRGTVKAGDLGSLLVILGAQSTSQIAVMNEKELRHTVVRTLHERGGIPISELMRASEFELLARGNALVKEPAINELGDVLLLSGGYDAESIVQMSTAEQRAAVLDELSVRGIPIGRLANASNNTLLEQALYALRPISFKPQVPPLQLKDKSSPASLLELAVKLNCPTAEEESQQQLRERVIGKIAEAKGNAVSKEALNLLSDDQLLAQGSVLLTDEGDGSQLPEIVVDNSPREFYSVSAPGTPMIAIEGSGDMEQAAAAQMHQHALTKSELQLQQLSLLLSQLSHRSNSTSGQPSRLSIPKSSLPVRHGASGSTTLDPVEMTVEIERLQARIEVLTQAEKELQVKLAESAEDRKRELERQQSNIESMEVVNFDILGKIAMLEEELVDAKQKLHEYPSAERLQAVEKLQEVISQLRVQAELSRVMQFPPVERRVDKELQRQQEALREERAAVQLAVEQQQRTLAAAIERERAAIEMLSTLDFDEKNGRQKLDFEQRRDWTQLEKLEFKERLEREATGWQHEVEARTHEEVEQLRNRLEEEAIKREEAEKAWRAQEAELREELVQRAHEIENEREQAQQAIKSFQAQIARLTHDGRKESGVRAQELQAQVVQMSKRLQSLNSESDAVRAHIREADLQQKHDAFVGEVTEYYDIVENFIAEAESLVKSDVEEQNQIEDSPSHAKPTPSNTDLIEQRLKKLYTALKLLTEEKKRANMASSIRRGSLYNMSQILAKPAEQLKTNELALSKKIREVNQRLQRYHVEPISADKAEKPSTPAAVFVDTNVPQEERKAINSMIVTDKHLEMEAKFMRDFKVSFPLQKDISLRFHGPEAGDIMLDTMRELQRWWGEYVRRADGIRVDVVRKRTANLEKMLQILDTIERKAQSSYHVLQELEFVTEEPFQKKRSLTIEELFQTLECAAQIKKERALALLDAVGKPAKARIETAPSTVIAPLEEDPLAAEKNPLLRKHIVPFSLTTDSRAMREPAHSSALRPATVTAGLIKAPSDKQPKFKRTIDKSAMHVIEGNKAPQHRREGSEGLPPVAPGRQLVTAGSATVSTRATTALTETTWDRSVASTPSFPEAEPPIKPRPAFLPSLESLRSVGTTSKDTTNESMGPAASPLSPVRTSKDPEYPQSPTNHAGTDPAGKPPVWSSSSKPRSRRKKQQTASAEPANTLQPLPSASPTPPQPSSILRSKATALATSDEDETEEAPKPTFSEFMRNKRASPEISFRKRNLEKLRKNETTEQRLRRALGKDAPNAQLSTSMPALPQSATASATGKLSRSVSFANSPDTHKPKRVSQSGGSGVNLPTLSAFRGAA
eukprot:TRINITY_DN8067_c0_g3_i1.p1 TRINITY_DN8067_c0_g3~~TRINITY_DN8067_c0_g3_i1.p1  ORF type:complete len:2308 (+),score=543.67 TRINITY_DN8067_c0_g3_i1:39-6962(+)